MAYNTSVLITGNNSVDLQMRSESVLNHSNKLFGANDLALNTDKINVIQFNLNYIQEDQSKVSTKLKKKKIKI